MLGQRQQTNGEPGLNVEIYHHPTNWLDPNFRREFIRQIESFAHIAFTGHEHQNDEDWSESASGEHTTFIDADALQDRAYPKTSGFVALVLDIAESNQHYYHFRWKQDQYVPYRAGKRGCPGGDAPLSLTRTSVRMATWPRSCYDGVAWIR